MDGAVSETYAFESFFLDKKTYTDVLEYVVVDTSGLEWDLRASAPF